MQETRFLTEAQDVSCALVHSVVAIAVATAVKLTVMINPLQIS
ncbi:MAG: hypothetical protein ACRAVC_18245 [Trichormus sp.]